MELIFSLNEIKNAVEKFWNYVQKNYPKVNVFAFYGKMGSGKTTFIKHLCQILDVKDTVTSPTFAIINEYERKNGEMIYHFDFYRLKNINEVLNIGAEDYFYSNLICFIEWPDIAEDILPEHTLKIKITELENQKRKLTII